MKNCSNCEHKKICMYRLGFKIDEDCCKHWQGWIKCEDGLPSGFKQVVVAIRYSDNIGIDVAMYRFDIEEWYELSELYSPRSECIHNKVIAWRPLPEYEEEQNVKQTEKQDNNLATATGL